MSAPEKPQLIPLSAEEKEVIFLAATLAGPRDPDNPGLWWSKVYDSIPAAVDLIGPHPYNKLAARVGDLTQGKIKKFTGRLVGVYRELDILPQSRANRAIVLLHTGTDQEPPQNLVAAGVVQPGQGIEIVRTDWLEPRVEAMCRALTRQLGHVVRVTVAIEDTKESAKKVRVLKHFEPVPDTDDAQTAR